VENLAEAISCGKPGGNSGEKTGGNSRGKPVGHSGRIINQSWNRFSTTVPNRFSTTVSTGSLGVKDLLFLKKNLLENSQGLYKHTKNIDFSI
jgi:hypothetical protein